MLKKSRRLREQPIKLAAVVGAVWLAALLSVGLYSEHASVPTSAAAAVFQLPSVVGDGVSSE